VITIAFAWSSFVGGLAGDLILSLAKPRIGNKMKITQCSCRIVKEFFKNEILEEWLKWSSRCWLPFYAAGEQKKDGEGTFLHT
jgi:hypothetical protein